MGTDLEVDIPDKISAIQLQEIRNILRQAREFEYNYDSTVFMPRDSREIMNEATSKVTEITPCDDEVIIGNKIEKGIVK